jgi:predicted O-methyltransferase YrrM
MEVLQVQDELERMLALYDERKPQRVLEIGVWYGGTLKEWLIRAAPNSLVVAVDLHHPNARSYDHWREVGTDLQVIYGKSQDPAIVESVRRLGPYDWVFIDGDHGFDAVRVDVFNYQQMIAPGGVLLMHDIAAPDGSEDALYPPGHVFGTLANAYDTDAYVTKEACDVAHGIGVVFF